MRNEKQKLRTILLLGSVMLIVCIGGAVFWYFGVQSLDERVVELARERRTLEQEENNAQDVNMFLQETMEERNRIENYVIGSQEETIQLIELLDSTLADEFNVAVELSPTEVMMTSPVAGSDEEAEEVPALEISLEAEGAFDNVFGYLSVLEMLPQHLVFEEVVLSGGTTQRIESGGEGSGSGQEWSMSTTFRIVSYQQED